MKKINTAHISDTAGMPVIKEHWDYLQDNINMLQEGVYSCITNYDLSTGNTPIILHGAEVTSISSTSITVTTGYVLYNGEIYKLDAGTYTKTAPQTWLLSTQTIIASTKDPLTYTDGSTFSTFENRSALIYGGTSGTSNIGDFLVVKRNVLHQVDTTVVSTSIFNTMTPTNCTIDSLAIVGYKKGEWINVNGKITVTATSTAVPSIQMAFSNSWNNYFGAPIYGAPVSIQNPTGSYITGLIHAEGLPPSLVFPDATYTASGQYIAHFHLSYLASQLG